MRRPPNKKMICPKCKGIKAHKSNICIKCWCASHGNGTRTKDVVLGIALSRTVGEIAEQLGISSKAVEWHWARAKAKYNLHCAQDAVWCALRRGWVSPSGERVTLA